MSRSSSVTGSDGQIEFLAPNDAAFGMSDVADFVGFDGADEAVFGDDGPQSKWLPAIAAVVVFALLGGGVIAAAPWDDGQAAPAPTTTEVATSTTVAAPTTTERVLDIDSFGPPGYVLTEPGAFQVAGAFATEAGDDLPLLDRFDVWATPDASRTSGRWLAASTTSSRGTYEQFVPDGVRVQVGAGAGVVASSPDGVASLWFVSNDDTPFEVQAFGFGLAELLSVASQIGQGDDGTIDYGSLPGGLMADLSPVTSARLPDGGLNIYGLLGQPEQSSFYVRNDTGASTQNLSIRVTESNDVAIAFQRFMMLPPPELSVADQTELDRLRSLGMPFQISTMPDDEQLYVAIGLAGLPVTILSHNVDVSTLISTISQLRPAGEFEWADLVDRSRHNEIEIDGPQVSRGDPPVMIGRAAPADDDDWTVHLQPSDPSYVILSGNDFGWGGQLGDVDSAPAVRHFSSASRTFLVATVEWPNEARRVRVTVEGQSPVEIPMMQVNDTVYAAAYAYRQAVPATVEFLDDDGIVVDSTGADPTAVVEPAIESATVAAP